MIGFVIGVIVGFVIGIGGTIVWVTKSVMGAYK